MLVVVVVAVGVVVVAVAVAVVVVVVIIVVVRITQTTEQSPNLKSWMSPKYLVKLSNIKRPLRAASPLLLQPR